MKEITLTQGKVALVDDEDFEGLNKHKWQLLRAKTTNYAIRREGKTIYMHREVLNAKAGDYVDHRDSNGLNNQRGNIRLCSQSQNNGNQRCQTRERSSMYKGVSINKRAMNWEAHIKIHGRKKFLGYHNTETEAAIAYNKAALEFFGEFARPNVI